MLWQLLQQLMLIHVSDALLGLVVQKISDVILHFIPVLLHDVRSSLSLVLLMELLVVVAFLADFFVQVVHPELGDANAIWVVQAGASSQHPVTMIAYLERGRQLKARLELDFAVW